MSSTTTKTLKFLITIQMIFRKHNVLTISLLCSACEHFAPSNFAVARRGSRPVFGGERGPWPEIIEIYLNPLVNQNEREIFYGFPRPFYPPSSIFSSFVIKFIRRVCGLNSKIIIYTHFCHSRNSYPTIKYSMKRTHGRTV